MSWAASHSSVPPVPGEVRLVDFIDVPLHLAQAESSGLLAVRMEAPGPPERGRLALWVEAAIEQALERRGACPPGIGAAASLDNSFSDQLYRARLLELRGVVLCVPALRGIASWTGVLDAEDSAVLRWWLDATERAPLRILLDRENAQLGVYGPPRTLMEFLGRREPLREPAEAAPILAPAVADSAAAMELSEPPPAVVERDGALAFEQPLADTELDEGAPAPATRAEARLANASEGAEPIGDIAEAILRTLAETSPTPPETEVRPEPQGLAVPPLYPNAAGEWRSWLHELETVRGAKPLAAIERMFVSSYVPLREAWMNGIADEDAERALSRWASSFATSYEEAFEALRVRGKRPTMVLDVPDLALRIGRLHGARSVQLLLVDGMRFDLGLRIEQRVRGLLGQQAALTERLLLWSALPTTSETQLELLGRGAEGLRAGTADSSFQVPVARGRAAGTLRRIKAGHRELLKLDVVEARLADPGPSELTRLDTIAAETATVLADYVGKQPPRTLVLAFGDHGFALDPLDAKGGTQAARQGGASPEEVLVPAFAWLVGGVH